MKKYYLYIIPLFLVFVIPIKAQETLTGLQQNPKIKSLYLKKPKIESYRKTKSLKSKIELPFIDDFAKSIGYADDSLWLDDYIFVNQTYASDPLSIGVATLDAIDGTGNIHSNASTSSFGADTLTSNVINLDYPGDNTIYISFYFQPGGLGDTPETKDSLLLEFLASDTVWVKKWHAIFNATDSVLTEEYFGNVDTTIKITNGDTLTDLRTVFQQVILPVDDNKFLHENFQFRFRNYASLSTSSSIESKAGNSDHWHLDFIILDKDRNINDTVINDIAFSKPMASLLKNYDAIPWSHYNRALAYEMEDSISITYRNLNNDVKNVDREFEIEDLMGATGIYPFTGESGDNIPPFTEETYKRYIDYIFPYDPLTDSALFEIRSFFDLGTNIVEESYRWNDTVRFFQKFYNYYAYDDGTAENGYGLIGEGTERAMVAMKFNTYKEDTLRAVQIFFNPVLNNATQTNTFRLHIWKESAGEPGNIIHTIESLKPQNEDELNKFTTFVLDTAIALDGNFFIGWQKNNTSEMLNVGFDVNRINNDKLYYNFTGNWAKSKFEGTIMIRPLFGEDLNVTSGATSPISEIIDFKIYPNPANDYLNVELNNSKQNISYTIFDAYGKVYKNEYYNQSTIDISNLNSGIYFIRFSNSNQNFTTKKFIVVR